MKQNIHRKSGRQQRVLIAEDSASMRQNLVDSLSDLPQMEVIGTARDDVETIKSARWGKLDVLILGVHTSGGAGWAF